jgi:hypothetical protein
MRCATEQGRQKNVLARALWLVFGGLLATALVLVVFLTVQQQASAPSEGEGSSKDQAKQEDLKDQQPESEEVTSEDELQKDEAPKGLEVWEEQATPKYQQPKYEQPNKDEGPPRW